MTYDDLKEKDTRKMRDLNRKNRWRLSSDQLKRLVGKHRKAKQSGY